MKTSNMKCRKFVESLQDFKANNIFAETHGNLYFVFSYGHHWPLYIYDKVKKQWYVNQDKYSVSTSKHHGQACPFGHKDYENAIYLPCQKMRELY